MKIMANDVWSFSTGSNRIQMQGNAKIIQEIRNLANDAISKKISLYDAQENIKKYLYEKYGNVWYEKSGEAVQYIIEDAYSSAMRYAEISDNNSSSVWF